MTSLSITSAGDNIFQNLTTYLLGLNINTTDTAKANKLWTQFLTSQGFATEAAFETALTNGGATAVTKYTNLYNIFVLEQLAKTYQSESIILQSTDEQQQRDIVFKTFSLVLHMLSTLQKSMQASSEALVLYTKIQQQYTELLKKIPLSTLSPGEATRVDITNIGKTILGGYGNITISDVLKFLLNKVKDASNNFTQNGSSSTRGSNDSDLGFSVSYVNTTHTLTFNCSRLSYSTNYATGTADVSNMSSQEIMDAAPEVLLKTATATLGYLAPIGDTFTFMTQPAYTAPSTKPLVATSQDPMNRSEEDRQRQQLRAEINGQLQVYISNAQANRDLAQSASKPIENLVNQIREAIQAQLTLLNNIIELLKGLLGAVTRS